MAVHPRGVGERFRPAVCAYGVEEDECCVEGEVCGT